MKRLFHDIARTEEFFRGLFEGTCPTWSEVVFIEDLSQYRSNDGFVEVPQAALMSPGQYEPQFDQLVNECSWINFNAVGIFDNKLIVNLEYPRQRDPHRKQDLMSVNLSGPVRKSPDCADLDWDWTDKMAIIDD